MMEVVLLGRGEAGEVVATMGVRSIDWGNGNPQPQGGYMSPRHDRS